MSIGISNKNLIGGECAGHILVTMRVRVKRDPMAVPGASVTGCWCHQEEMRDPQWAEPEQATGTAKPKYQQSLFSFF